MSSRGLRSQETLGNESNGLSFFFHFQDSWSPSLLAVFRFLVALPGSIRCPVLYETRDFASKLRLMLFAGHPSCCLLFQ